MKDDDEIVFDRDTSKPKDKLKKRKRRKEKEKVETNINNINSNQNLNNSVNIYKEIKEEVNINKKEESNLNTISNVNLNSNNNLINNEKEISQKDDLVNFNMNSNDNNEINSNLNKELVNENDKDNDNLNSGNEQNMLDSNEINDNLKSLEENENNSLEQNENNRYENEPQNDTNQNFDSQTKENDYLNSQTNNTKSKFIYSQEKTDNNIKITDKDNMEKEYQDALKSGDKDRIIIILQRKVEYLELNINDLNLLIQHLRNDIHKKEKIMHILTDTNTELKNSLNKFSKLLDKKIFDMDKNQNKNKAYKNSKSLKRIYSKNYNQLEEGKDINSELNKALARNKQLQKENDNLKNMIDMSNKVEKMKELENSIKIMKEKNCKLEEEISQMKRDIVDHSYCEKKRNSLLEKIKYLTEENNQYKKYIKKLNAENNNLDDKKKNDQTILNTTRSHENTKLNIKTKKYLTQLPKISNKNKKLENDKKDEEIESLADKDEINILIKLYQGDTTKYTEFRKKLIIYAKCKENIINKYKADEKANSKKVYSMQEQIEYLNHKVKESEMRINIFQQQINDKDFQNKKLKKKLNEDKTEKNNSKQKLSDFE